MSATIARRISPVGAAITLLVTGIALASPAHAAVGVDLTVSDTTITEGESITLSWTSTDAVTLVASEGWTGSKAIPSDSEVITPVGTGTRTYTLTATDATDATDADSVTVTVAPASAEVTPLPVTFPNACRVVIPETANVTYLINYGGSYSEPVEAGTYPGARFYAGGSPVWFVAQADEGFTLADGVPTRWRYTATEDCLEYGPQLVKTAVECGAVRFTNVFTETIFVQAGDPDAEEPETTFGLVAGASRTIETSRRVLYYSASYYAGDDGQGSARHTGELDVPQGCGAHPTVAPAAGY